MKKQRQEEETEKAKITSAFNLPYGYVLHTVGPIVYGSLQEKDKELLASCYRSCLQLADSQGIRSISFFIVSQRENFTFPIIWRQKLP